MSWTLNAATGTHALAVTPEMIAEAKAERERRDAEATNRYPVDGVDQRWHGHLAEAVFCAWLTKHGIDFTHNGGRDALPDYEVGGARIALKDRHATRMRPDYEVSVGVVDLEAEADLFAFTCFEPSQRRVLVLGAQTREDYARRARLVKSGEQLFGVRWLVDCLLLKAEDLYPPSVLAGALARKAHEPGA